MLVLGPLVASAALLFGAPAARNVAIRATVHAEFPFANVELDAEQKQAIQAAMEAQEKMRQEEAMAAEAAAWRSLEEALPPAGERAPPVLTLYRDTNGWCPFCERVWLQLLAKGIPFREELIDLRDKPDWYKEMVPTTLVPAVKYDSDSVVTWESVDVMRQIEERFPDHQALLPPSGTDARERVESLMERCADVLGAGVRMSYPNASATDAERLAGREAFEAQLDALDAAVGEAGGPFLAGSDFSLADCMYIPMMERWAVQVRAGARDAEARARVHRTSRGR